MSDAAEPVARAVRVTHRFGGITALNEISLEVSSGSSVALIGPDGVGKSTLLGLIAGARKIQTGTVELFGEDLRRARARRRVCSRVAYMPQGLGRNLYPELSVVENVDFFARLFGVPRRERAERIGALLASTGLDPFPDRPARALSGGMKQKLGLCCALIHDPGLLILDEPTTGIDPLSRHQFWELIDQMRAGQPEMSVLVATAYMEEAERFEQLIALDAGRVLASGTPAAIKQRTGKTDLEDAFIALLPEERRRGHRAPVAPPRVATDGEAAIEARDLTRRFGDFTAVDRVSFRIDRGEIYGFLGSNGCGKTTTMKMLAGLLPISAGDARLFGQPVDATARETRRRIGFMSQTFSLYRELSTRRNLELHAHLFHIEPARVPARVDEMIERFGLEAVAAQTADELPLGIQQRLSLAVAMIHQPEILILDEPTSGVDPIARDQFWGHLIELSRSDGVTIFLSTHFMNEAERCDRVSLMHAGRVLSEGSPDEIMRDQSADSLEAAFVELLHRRGEGGRTPRIVPAAVRPGSLGAPARLAASLGRAWAYTLRESKDIRRDPVRLAFALGGPVLMLLVFGYGITFDVENLPYAHLDRDDSSESRRYLDEFAGSAYFREQPALRDPVELERRLESGELRFAIEIPPHFGRDLLRASPPEVSVWLDGAMPFVAETTRGYVEGVHLRYLRELAERAGAQAPRAASAIETRFRYNPEFESIYAIVPGNLTMILMMIPAIMTALGIVREKELGSIVNLYVTPVNRLEFLVGKQLPYVGVAMLSFVLMMAVIAFVFGVRVAGSPAALFLGALLYVGASTAWGLVVSSFVRTQLAAIFGTAIITALPSIQLSGLLHPVSSLSPVAQMMGRAFPPSWFQHISVGTFAKELGFAALVPDYLALAAFIGVLLLVARVRLRPQAS